MNCYKSINITKEIGQNRLFIISMLIGTLSFIVLYVPYSLHHASHLKQTGLLPFIIALSLLPSIHVCMNILPLIIMKKRIKVYYKRKYIFFPAFYYYTASHLTKKAALSAAIAPTLFITIPGLIASFLFPDFFVYILFLTCIHMGFSFIDFLVIRHIMKAPKRALFQNVNDGFDILLKEN